MRMRFLGILLLLAGTFAGVFIWWRYFAPVELAAVHPTRGTAADVVYATGTVEPEKWAKVIRFANIKID